MTQTQHVTDQEHLTSQAYATEDLLSIRIKTHELYSQPKQDFTAWILDLIPWMGNETVLDVGCGAGLYISPIEERLTSGGMIVSADLSLGMLFDVAQKEFASDTNLLNSNILQLPFPNDSCDVILANHMLYHVPDIPAAIAEIKRVLRPDGYLIAATNAKDSMMTMVKEIETAYEALGEPIQIPPTPPRINFSLENGGKNIEPEFLDIQIHRFESFLVFPEAAPVVAYINSMQSFYEPQISTSIPWEKFLSQVEKQITQKIIEQGEYRVAKTTGAFVAQNTGQIMNNSTIHSGFVSVMGRPNVGKSTLINALMGQKIAAVSPRAQTTRQQQLGILTTDEMQIIFIDTPGLHKPHHKLGKYMNQEAAATLEDGDLILFLVEASQNPPHEEDHILVELLSEVKNPPPVVLALNKIDRLKTGELEERTAIYQDLLPSAQILPISATGRKGLDVLLETLKEQLPKGDYFYPEDQVTDLYEKEIAADLIREAALLHLRDEVPHALAVRIDEFTERGDSGAYIGATLFVERDSQKGIVIGKDGKMLKRIGSTARQEIEKMSGRKVFLKLRIKVRKNWRNDDTSLRRFGFQSK